MCVQGLCFGGSCVDTIEVKCETTLLSTSKSKKGKRPSPAEDNLELSDTPDSGITTDGSDLRKKLLTSQRKAAAWLEDPGGTSLMSSSCLHRPVTKTRMAKPQEVSTQSQGNPSQRRRRRRSWDRVRPDGLTANEDIVARPVTDEASPARSAPYRASRAARPSGKYAGPDWQ